MGNKLPWRGVESVLFFIFKSVSVDSFWLLSFTCRMLHNFNQDFDKVIEGGTAEEINTENLSGGARINRVFHERFPFELVKLQFDEKSIRRKIGFAIKNVYGVRSGLFTPDMAFESIVKEQIERLKTPAIMCVDMVINEINGIIKKCTEKVWL